MKLQINYPETGIKEYNTTKDDGLELIETALFLGAKVRWFSTLLNDWTNWV